MAEMVTSSKSLTNVAEVQRGALRRFQTSGPAAAAGDPEPEA